MSHNDLKTMVAGAKWRKQGWLWRPAIAGIFLASMVSGCGIGEPPGSEESTLPGVPMEDISQPEDFDFSIRSQHFLEVSAESPAGTINPGVLVSVRSMVGEVLARGVTGPDGIACLAFVTRSPDLDVVVAAPAIGIVQGEQQVTLNNGHLVINMR